MNKMTKGLSIALITGILATVTVGCGDSVDQKRLIQLTGDKNFKQIEQAWAVSVLQEKPADQKIYAYWLKENGTKADPTFNFENFKQSIMLKYNKQIDQVKKHMNDIKIGVDQIVKKAKEKHIKPEFYTIRKLENEKTMASFQAGTSAFIRKTYFPFLVKQIERIEKAQDEVDAYDRKGI